MSKLPEIDFSSAWLCLSGSTRDEIGALVLKEAFLRFAAEYLVGDQLGEGVRYLDLDGQEDAELNADEAAVEIRTLLHNHYPDLFGEGPSPDRPNGSDPPWADPIVFRVA
ncbi:hypothetical protein [Enterovirga sp. CN4-39]|uniref:hypothetical protein n=1 Tax=Enterovirga sp. CN4-39 TaxID=3400910 RepID=UPI003C0273F3